MNHIVGMGEQPESPYQGFQLKEALEPVLEQYNFILIDCPPSLGLLSYISLVAATYVLVPIQTQYKSFCGTELLLST